MKSPITNNSDYMKVVFLPKEVNALNYLGFMTVATWIATKELSLAYNTLYAGPDQQFAQFIGYQSKSTDPLEALFLTLAREWKKDTGSYSLIAKRYNHPAYKKILEMKAAAIPFILEELRRNPDRWFDALEKISGQDAASSAKTFYEAVDMWIAWGIANEIIS